MNNLQQAISILRAGGIIGMPTETVYGLAGDASNETAIKKIFAVKERPAKYPLIVHIGKTSEMENWAIEIPQEAYLLAKKFWPGPLTLILKKGSHVSPIITGNQDTVGLRIPAHPIALKLLRRFKSGIAAPSANKFGRISPTTSKAVREELGDAVEFILEGGKCDVGVESTIVDMSSEHVRILRPGMISVAAIEKVLKKKLLEHEKDIPVVAGSCKSHYAPKTPVVILSKQQLVHEINKTSERIGVMVFDVKRIAALHIVWTTLSCDPKRYAHDLYFVLREMDQLNLTKIFVEAIPDGVEWDAVRDRLSKASFQDE